MPVIAIIKKGVRIAIGPWFHLMTDDTDADFHEFLAMTAALYVMMV